MEYGQPDQVRPGLYLLGHDSVIFEDQTVYLSGNAYLNCEFRRCVLVVIGAPNTALNKCTFSACIWHLNTLLHDESQVTELIRLLNDIAMKCIPRDSREAPEATHSNDVPPTPKSPSQ